MSVRRSVPCFAVALIGVVAFAVNACGGTVPPRSPIADDVQAATSIPTVSAIPIRSSGPAGSRIPVGSTAPVGALVIVAEDSNFTPTEVSAPAGKAFNIVFQNKDPNVFHDIDITSPDGSKIIFDGVLVYGPKDITYDVPALPAGAYQFKCSVHPGQMTGTFTAG